MPPRNRMLPCCSLILALALLVFLALPAAAGEKAPGVTVKSDGDDIVLIPDEPGKVFLILGFPSEKKGQESRKDLQGRLSYLMGEARFPSKDYARILIWELGPSAEVDMDRRTLVSSRAKPLPPGCPPRCPGILAYLTCGGKLCDSAHREAVSPDGAEVP